MHMAQGTVLPHAAPPCVPFHGSARFNEGTRGARARVPQAARCLWRRCLFACMDGMKR